MQTEPGLNLVLKSEIKGLSMSNHWDKIIDIFCIISEERL